MSADSDTAAITTTLRGIFAAARSGDWDAVWRSYSRVAQGLCRAAAAASGARGADGGAVLRHLANLDGGPIPWPSDVEIDEVVVDGDRATVTVSSSSRDEQATLSFVIEDGVWRVSIRGGCRA